MFFYGFTITSAVDNPDELVYHKGAVGIFEEPCTFDTMQLGVINTETNEQLESFTFSRDPEAKAIDGSLLYVDDVVAGSAYIKVINNENNIECPTSTLAGTPVSATGGSNGEAVTPADLVKALTVFEDKIHLINYKKLLVLEDEKIVLSTNNTIVTITGEKLSLKKLLQNEVLLSGVIRKIEVNYA